MTTDRDRLKAREERLRDELTRRTASTSDRQAAMLRGVPLPRVELDDNGEPVRQPNASEAQADRLRGPGT